MSTPDAQPCKHPTIQTFRFADTGEPAGLWACADCRRKFAPLDVESAAEIERLRADAARLRAAGDTAAKAMSLLTPHGICEDAHHAKADRHEAGEPCPVATRYIAAYHGLREVIDAAMRDAPNDRGNRQ